MPGTWARTWPNTTSHSTGCTAREKTSVGSRTSFISSTCATAALSRRNLSTAVRSPQAPRGSASLSNSAEISVFADPATRVLREHVIHGCAGAEPCPQLQRFADDSDLPRVQDYQLVAERFGFL